MDSGVPDDNPKSISAVEFAILPKGDSHVNAKQLFRI